MTPQGDRALLAEYLRTAWTVEGPDGPLVVRVDGPVPDGLLRPSALVTAYNPASRPASDLDNRRAHDRLLHELRRRALPFRPCLARAPADLSWDEPGFAVLGDVRDAAVELGVEFGQNAVVWVDVRGRVSLVCTRAGFCDAAVGDVLEPDDAPAPAPETHPRFG